jgi:glutamate racemase
LKANPIGIIDSGVGGLTVVKEVIRQLPNESVIYLGDTARCPYGPRPAHEIKRFTWEMTRFLQQFRIKMLIIACNTATAVALDEIRSGLSIPVIGVIHPGSRAAIKISETKRIGVIGTEMTIKSKAYERALKSIHKSIFVTGLACPDFVPLVERGEWSGEEAERTVARSLAPLKSQNIDTLILGCTHYPLLEPVIDRFFEHRLHLISSGEETAREASFLLDYMDLLNDSGATPRHLFFTTGEAEKFKCLAEKWLDLGEVEVETIRL